MVHVLDNQHVVVVVVVVGMMVVVTVMLALLVYLIDRVLQEWLFQDQKCILVTSQVYLQTGTTNSFQLKCHQVYILFMVSFFQLCQILKFISMSLRLYQKVCHVGLVVKCPHIYVHCT